MNTVEKVCKNDCTGCGACYNSCPFGAIQMKPDEEGFLYPVIDAGICIGCGLCYKKCPAVNEDYYSGYEPPVLYAAYASDEIRMESSSGGMFTVLAEHIIDEGGYVCGVRWDGNWNAVYDLTDSKDELCRMRGSKYVQSDTKTVFRQIKQQLRENRKVLFTGCPCQTAGLRHYLGEDYDNLYNVDLVCHGAPSPKAFAVFLKMVVRSLGAEEPEKYAEHIESIQFRDKQRYGWGHSLIIRLKNGKEYDKKRNETQWYNSFLNNLNCRSSCGHCRYAQLPRQGDITLGDFWGIESAMPEIDSRKGVSVVAINSEKGKELFEAVSRRLGFVRESTLDAAQKSNWSLVGSFQSHKNRYRFFELLNMYDDNDYDKMVDYSINRKFDIGYIGWWYGKNYGSMLTNFALHQYVKSTKRSVLMIRWPLRSRKEAAGRNEMAEHLGKNYYEVSMDRTLNELYQLNRYCDSFLVGSDQLWNFYSACKRDYFYFLDFVEDSKKKISYATSFGHSDINVPEWYLKNASFYLSRFDHVSVREKEAVDICRDIWGVEAQQTADPVFICDRQEYINLIERSRIVKENPYIFAYVLTPTLEKREALIKMAEKTGLDIKLVLDGQFDFEKNREIMDMDDKLVVPNEIEDWLSLIYNSDYVYTDSYHGTCFSIIFEKQFSCIANMKRGLPRFISLLGSVALIDRMVYEPLKSIMLTDKAIDYKSVSRLLEKEVSRSREWLDNALSSRKICRASEYDLIMNEIRSLREEMHQLKDMLK